MRVLGLSKGCPDEAGAFGGPFDETGDIDELDGGGDDLGGIRHLREGVESLVRHGDHAHIGVDGAKGVVGGLRVTGAGEGVEEGGFPHVGHSDDSGFEHGGAEVAQDGECENPQVA